MKRLEGVTQALGAEGRLKECGGGISGSKMINTLHMHDLYNLYTLHVGQVRFGCSVNTDRFERRE